MKKIVGCLLLAFGMLWLALAVFTLLPDPADSKVCHLGYNANCAFTPWSGLILTGMALIGFTGGFTLVRNSQKDATAAIL